MEGVLYLHVLCASIFQDGGRVLYLHVLYAFTFQHMPVGNKTVHNQWSAFVIEHMLLYLGNIWQKYASVLSKGIYFYMHC